MYFDICRLHAPLDGRYLTSKLLEVLPAMPAAAQHDALGLLEEVADDDDYEVISGMMILAPIKRHIPAHT